MTAVVAAAGSRSALAFVAVVAVTAAGVQVWALGRYRVRERLLVIWTVLAAVSAALWVAAAVTASTDWATAAVAALWLAELALAGAVVWARVPLLTLANARTYVDLVAVGVAASAVWVIAVVPPDAPGVRAREVLLAVGVLGVVTLAYSIIGNNNGDAKVMRVNAAISGAGGVLWANDALRGGSAPWTWAVAIGLTVGFAAALFVAVSRRRAMPPAPGTPRAIREEAWLEPSPVASGDLAPIGRSPMFAGIVESTLWMVIVAHQARRPIELSVVLAACIAAAAISLRSMTRWIENNRAVRSLQRLADTDPLTGLPNRRGFARALSDCRPGALALIDLDGFKLVNDRLGHAAGDDLLIAIAELGRRRQPAGATFARLGGDEFGLVVPGDASWAVAAAEDIVTAIAELRLAGHVTASAGVAEICADAEDTLRNAGFALHWAKRAGRGHTMQLSEEMVASEVRRSQLAEALAADVELGRLQLAYQPIVRIADCTVVGAEALARWCHPIHGAVAPDEFISIAEEHGFIDRVGELVLDQVVAQIAEWAPLGLAPDVAVNVSGMQLRRPQTVQRYAERVAAGGATGKVSIEVTESAIVDDESLETLAQLRALGFRYAIDDFGTGYASISGFMRMRPDRLKIDRRFVHDLGTPDGARSRVLVEAVVGIAHQFGVEVVAEGVETEAALDVLAAVGCDYAQGYLLGPPGSAADLARAMRSYAGPAGRRPSA